MSSPAVWYPANRVSGWCMILAAVLALGLNLALWITHPDWTDKKLLLWMANTMAGTLLLSVAASFYYLRKL